MLFGPGRGGVDGFVDPVGDLTGVVDVLVDLDPVAMPRAALSTDLLRFARQRDRQDATFAAWVLAAVRTGIGVEDGHVDTVAWLSWKTGTTRADLRKMLRCAELAELLPETGAAWREGRISSTAVELIAAARVPGFDEDLAAMESEFLERAMRGDHKTLKMLTEHFRACARADGNKPAPPDECTVAFVGDRCLGRFDVTKAAGQTIIETLETFTRPPPHTTTRASPCGRPTAWSGCVR
jgi:hypothetical protein